MALSGGSTYFADDGAAYELFLGRFTQELAERLVREHALGLAAHVAEHVHDI